MRNQITFVIGALSSALFGLGASLNTYAEMPVEFRLSGQPVYTQIKSEGETFSPTLFHFKASVEGSRSILGGIGLQAVMAVPMSDASNDGLTVSVKEQNALYLTLSNPATEHEDIRFTLLLGYSSSQLETQVGEQGAIVNTFDGASYGFSFHQKVLENKPLFWSLDCTRFYRDDNLRFDGCGLGATYAF